MSKDKFARLVTDLIPFVESIEAQARLMADGKTCYYAVYRLPGDTMNQHAQDSLYPRIAYRNARQAILTRIRKQP